MLVISQTRKEGCVFFISVFPYKINLKKINENIDKFNSGDINSKLMVSKMENKNILTLIIDYK